MASKDKRERRDEHSLSKESSKRSREPEEEKKHKKSKHSRKERSDDSGSSSDDASDKEKEKEKASRSKSKKDKKEKDKHKKDKKKHKHSSKSKSEEAVSVEDIKKISEDDYFLRNGEFRIWLVEDKGVVFDELTAEETRKHFGKFAEKWNEGGLKAKYYKGIDINVTNDPSMRTRYKWGFAEKLDFVEMGIVRDSVGDLTQSKKPLEKPSEPSRVIGPTMPTAMDIARSSKEFPSADPEDYDTRKRAMKAELERRELVLDELAPKETGREAMLAKKRAKGEYTRRERDEMPEVNESELMGGGDDFKSRLAAEKRRQQKRQEISQQRKEDKQAVMVDKLKAFQSKEEATLAMFREMAKHHKLGS